MSIISLPAGMYKSRNGKVELAIKLPVRLKPPGNWKLSRPGTVLPDTIVRLRSGQKQSPKLQRFMRQAFIFDIGQDSCHASPSFVFIEVKAILCPADLCVAG